MNVPSFIKKKIDQNPISMVTCYDYSFAKVIDESEIDCILVGDSVAMVMHGHPDTTHATTEMMCTHIKAVRRGTNKFIVGDFPFLEARKGVSHGVEIAQKIIRAGAQAVKIEGVDGHEELIQYLTESGIPVMGHLGLTPQFVHAFGGFRVQGRSEDQQEKILKQARKLEELGCFSVVLECVPSSLANKITSSLSIPTIGIGAGIDVDGQVLVLQDLLGLADMKLKFVRKYETLNEKTLHSLNLYHREVGNKQFPNETELFQ